MGSEKVEEIARRIDKLSPSGQLVIKNLLKVMVEGNRKLEKLNNAEVSEACSERLHDECPPISCSCWCHQPSVD